MPGRNSVFRCDAVFGLAFFNCEHAPAATAGAAVGIDRQASRLDGIEQTGTSTERKGFAPVGKSPTLVGIGRGTQSETLEVQRLGGDTRIAQGDQHAVQECGAGAEIEIRVRQRPELDSQEAGADFLGGPLQWPGYQYPHVQSGMAPYKGAQSIPVQRFPFMANLPIEMHMPV